MLKNAITKSGINSFKIIYTTFLVCMIKYKEYKEYKEYKD